MMTMGFYVVYYIFYLLFVLYLFIDFLLCVYFTDIIYYTMSLLNEDKNLVHAAINNITSDGAIESPFDGNLKPRSSTNFSPAALQQAHQAINGTLFTGDDATHNFTPYHV